MMLGKRLAAGCALLLSVACAPAPEARPALAMPGDTLVLSSEFGTGDVVLTATAVPQPGDTAVMRVPPGTAAVLLEATGDSLDAGDGLVRYRVRTLVGAQATGWVYRGDTRAPGSGR